MQDLSTGELRPIFLDAFQNAIPKQAFQPFEALEKLKSAEGNLQAAKDAAIPIRENQGPIFSMGEIVTVKGGRFRISGITEKRIYLDSLPKE